MVISDITTKTAPIIVAYLPEYSLPNNKPKPIPPIRLVINPIFSIFIPSSKKKFKDSNEPLKS